MFYDAKARSVEGLNGSGRSPMKLTEDALRNLSAEDAISPAVWHPESIHCVTVPGAVAGWVDAYERWGSKRLAFSELLAPAIRLAEDGA